MWKVLQLIVKNCELVVRNEGLKIQVSAKGPVAVIAAMVIVVLVVLVGRG